MKPYYEEAGITIYHGDCREILPQLGRFDLLLTDPPYGIGADSEMHKKGGQKYGVAAAPKSFYADTQWDLQPADDDLLKLAISSSTHSIVFGGNYFSLGPARCVLVWNKQTNGAFADGELAWTNLDKPVRIKNHMWNGMLREGKEIRYDHPTQKPLEVMQWCISQVPHAVCSLIDPFMGSGTSLVAAKNLGILATGIELEERYCEVAANRLRQSVLNFEPEVVNG